MALIGNLIARFGADTTGYTKGVDEIRAKTTQMNGAMVAEAKAAGAKTKGAYATFLGDLNTQFGKKSLLGKTLKLAAGGGAIAAVNMGLGEVDALTKHALELKHQLEEGQVSAGQMADQFARSIPLLGKIYDAGRNIREIITGEEESAKRMAEAIQLGQDALQQHVNVFRDQAKKVDDYLKSIEDRSKRLTLTGPQLAAYNLGQGYGKDSAAIHDQADKEREKIKAEYSQRIQALTAKRDAERKTLSSGDVDSGILHEYTNPAYQAADNAVTIAKDAMQRALGVIDAGERTMIASRIQLAAQEWGKFGSEFLQNNPVLNSIKAQWAQMKGEADRIKDQLDPGREYLREVERLNSLKNTGLLTKSQFDTASLNAYNEAFKVTVETATEYAQRMADIQEKNKSIFAKYAQEHGGANERYLPMPELISRRESFSTPMIEKKDPTAAIEKSAKEITKAIKEAVSEILKDPFGTLVSISRI